MKILLEHVKRMAGATGEYRRPDEMSWIYIREGLVYSIQCLFGVELWRLEGAIRVWLMRFQTPRRQPSGAAVPLVLALMLWQMLDVTASAPCVE